MITFYTIIFIVGILYTFISLLLNIIAGGIHSGLHSGHVGHLGHANLDSNHMGGHHIMHSSTDIGQHSGLSDTFLSWLGVLINPMVAVSFLTVFGGFGILGADYFKFLPILTLLISLFSATVISTLMYRYVALPLYRSENSTDVAQDELVYTKAEVVSPILENGFGKIQYTVNSIRYTAPAKNYYGRAVKQGEEVIIYKIEDHVFYVIEYCDLQNVEKIDINQ